MDKKPIMNVTDRGGNAELRKWRLSDAEDLAAALNHKAILNNLRDGLPFPYTAQDATEYITAMLSADENNVFAFAITIDDRAVGSIGAFRQANIHARTAELGYYLAEEYWGQGIMTGAISQLCRLIFEATDILRIYAEPFSYNIGSRRALEKAGFQYEGLMRSNAVKNSKVVDMCLYSLTRSMESYPVRRLSPEEIPAAQALCWRVFQEFDAPQHIADFFVDAAYHRRGIGRRLFEAMRQDYETQVFTVHSSPYAVEVYQHLGFVPTDTEQLTDGLRYIPMRFEEKERKDALCGC